MRPGLGLSSRARPSAVVSRGGLDSAVATPHCASCPVTCVAHGAGVAVTCHHDAEAAALGLQKACRTGRWPLETADEIISAMRAIAPPGQASLDDATLTELRHWTAALLRVKPDADAEYARLRQITEEKENPAQPAELGSWLADKAVLVSAEPVAWFGPDQGVARAPAEPDREHQPRRAHLGQPGPRGLSPRRSIRDRQALKDLVADIAGRRVPAWPASGIQD